MLEIDGHDLDSLSRTMRDLHPTKPTAIIANTVKGKGVSFMENQSSWHHGAISDDILVKALKEIEQDE